jgi:hypothetical protein
LEANGLTLVGSNCASTGSPLPASPAQIEFNFSTGSDDLREDSELIVELYENMNSTVPFQVEYLKHDGDPPFDNDTFQSFIVQLQGPVPDHINLILGQHDSATQSDDTWNIDGINVMTWQSNGPDACWANDLREQDWSSDTPVYSLSSTLTLQRAGCKGGE